MSRRLLLKLAKAGMVTLREAGMDGIFAGHTTAEEVIRETILEA